MCVGSWSFNAASSKSLPLPYFNISSQLQTPIGGGIPYSAASSVWESSIKAIRTLIVISMIQRQTCSDFFIVCLFDCTCCLAFQVAWGVCHLKHWTRDIDRGHDERVLWGYLLTKLESKTFENGVTGALIYLVWTCNVRTSSCTSKYYFIGGHHIGPRHQHILFDYTQPPKPTSRTERRGWQVVYKMISRRCHDETGIPHTLEALTNCFLMPCSL